MGNDQPITGELRDAAARVPMFDGTVKAELAEGDFERLCDAIDAVYANLAQENGRMFGEVQNLTRSRNSMAEELERVTAQRDEEAMRLDVLRLATLELPRDSEGTVVCLGDVMAANAVPAEHWEVVGIGRDGLLFLSTGARIKAGACHHVSEAESIAYDARELEHRGAGHGYGSAREFYGALHRLVARVVDLCEERDAR